MIVLYIHFGRVNTEQTLALIFSKDVHLFRDCYIFADLVSTNQFIYCQFDCLPGLVISKTVLSDTFSKDNLTKGNCQGTQYQNCE